MRAGYLIQLGERIRLFGVQCLGLLGSEISRVNNIMTERKGERTINDCRKQTQSWSENKQISEHGSVQSVPKKRRPSRSKNMSSKLFHLELLSSYLHLAAQKL
jgi:hypothetical protein